MTLKLTSLKYLIISLFLIFAILLNIFFIKSVILGLILGLLYLAFYGFSWGKVFLPSDLKSWQLLFGSLFLISLISAAGAIIYYFYQFNQAIFLLFLILVPVITFIPYYICHPALACPPTRRDAESRKEKIDSHFRGNDKKIRKITSFLLTICYLITVAICLYLLFKARTGGAIRSPWQVVSSDFFIVYFIATAILLAITIFSKKTSFSLILISLHAALTLSVALIVYKLGYGFDPFIHQATEKEILNYGFVFPKPFYYLGQYILVVFLAKLTLAPIEWIDKLLILIGAAVFLPPTIYYSFRNTLPDSKKKSTVLPLTFFILPFSYFIVTAPQGLANLFLLLTIFISLIYLKSENWYWLIYLLILGAATTLIHPLSGVPLLFFLAFLILFTKIQNFGGKWEILRKAFLLELVIFASLIIPLIFIINSAISGSLSSIFNFQPALNWREFLPYLQNNFRLIYDIVYWYGNNLNFIIIILAILGWLALPKSETAKKIKIIYPLTFLILVFNYLILKNFITFESLIEYERADYSNRVLEIAFYFLLPFVLYFFLKIIEKIKTYPLTLKLAIILFFAAGLTASVYLSYPRNDDYYIDRGYNITQSDINTVRFIDKDAASDYIVLANQITAVAAIKEFGFKKYYPALDGSGRQYFYYPIPTGDPLYKFYEALVYQKADRETVVRAMDLVGVNSAYFVLNKYWWKFEPIVEQAKQSADSWQEIDSGEVYVFKYIR